MGILDPQLDPRTIGMLSAAFAGMDASGPSMMPVSFGQVVGRAGQAGLGAYSSSMEQLRKLAQTDALIDLEKQKTNLTKAQVEALIRKEQMLAPFMARIQARLGGGGAAPAQQPQVGMSDSSAIATGVPWAAASTLPQPAQSPLAPSNGGGFPFSMDEVAGLKLGTGVDLSELLKFANTQQNSPAGSYSHLPGQPPTYNADPTKGVTIGPNGAIQRMPGSENIAALAGLTRGAEKAAELPYQPPAPYNLAGGARLLTVEQARALAGAPPAPAPGAGPAPAQAAPLAAPAPLLARPGGAGAALEDPAFAAQKLEDAKTYGEAYRKMTNATLANPGKIARFQRIGELLQGYDGGSLSNISFELSRLGTSLGIKIDPKLGSKEAAEALSKEISLELRSTADGAGMPGAMSDADRDYLRSMTPQLAQTADGRRRIIEARVAIYKRELQVAQMAREYKKRFQVLDGDFFSQLDAWTSRNALFK